MNSLKFNKAVQRKIYDALTEKWIFVLFIFGMFGVFVSIFQFSESLVEWSRGKYISVFNNFHDNIQGRSFQEHLCQYVPIDAVYTWVNGSDPIFLQDLKSFTESKGPASAAKNKDVCNYPSCVQSHFLYTNWKQTVKLDYVKQQNVFLTNLNNSMEVTYKVSKNLTQTGTLLGFQDEKQVNLLKNITSFNVGVSEFNLSRTFWTTAWTAPHSHLMKRFVMISRVPMDLTEPDLLRVMNQQIVPNVANIWMHRNLSLAIVQLKNTQAADLLLQENLMLHNRVLRIHQAFLILQPPCKANDDTLSNIRFSDNEELRYSLRSLEEFAPWIRHVYLVTNGQIPSWLNTQSPRITIVPHQQIFPNSSHLPTFSSPAIEANIHRIPGLSTKFLYFNDDVFLGKPVWPEDFYSHQAGSTVFLTWSLPDCAPGCPSSWLQDGYCDQMCNSTQCMWDGGDCLGENPKIGVADHADFDPSKDWNGEGEIRCGENCADSWIGDRFCDESCNNVQCGFDAGDCGGQNLLNVPTLQLNQSQSNNSFKIPSGDLSVFWNVSNIANRSKILRTEPCSNPKIHSLSFNEQLNLIVLVVRNNTKSKCTFKIVVSVNRTRLKISVFVSWNTKTPVKTEKVPSVVAKASVIMRKLASTDLQESSGINPTSRRLLDAFSESLLHVNNLYNKDYGFINRKVPAHMPHLIDKNIFQELWEKYSYEWEQTSSHQVRSKTDMQYIFAYHHFLMQEKLTSTKQTIFDMFDTDKSGTWSDREIRTILAKIHPLPLNYEDVLIFENSLLNCSKAMFRPHSMLGGDDVAQLEADRYLESRLPLVTRELVVACQVIMDVIRPHVANGSKFKFRVEPKPDVAFKMLSSNVSQVVGMLDVLRKWPRKFFCLNDNMDPGRDEDNDIVRAILQDFLESILPKPSQFELSPGYRNRFLHIQDLGRWRWQRNLLQQATYLCVFFLFVLLAASYFNVDLGRVGLVLGRIVRLGRSTSKVKTKATVI